jgi:transcriptional regulator with XRE-family HTH domain
MRKQQKKIGELGEAVKRLREACGYSQEEFARRLNVTVTTVSRFETGRAEPREPRVLRSLAYFEGDRNQSIFRFTDPFLKAYKEQGDAIDESLAQPWPSAGIRSLREWRLVCAVRLAATCFPEAVAAIEKAAGEAMAIVDEVIIGAADETHIPYRQMERDAFSLADRKMRNDLKERKQQEEK